MMLYKKNEFKLVYIDKNTNFNACSNSNSIDVSYI